MADRFQATLKIGGDPGEHRAELEDLIELVSPDDRDEDDVMYLEFNEVRHDDFKELLEFCVKHGLPYDLSFSARYEFDGLLVWWRPGMEERRECYCSQSGEATFSAGELLQAVADNTGQPHELTVAAFLEKHIPTAMEDFAGALDEEPAKVQ